jgi:hypothetical protein
MGCPPPLHRSAGNRRDLGERGQGSALSANLCTRLRHADCPTGPVLPVSPRVSSSSLWGRLMAPAQLSLSQSPALQSAPDRAVHLASVTPTAHPEQRPASPTTIESQAASDRGPRPLEAKNWTATRRRSTLPASVSPPSYRPGIRGTTLVPTLLHLRPTRSAPTGQFLAGPVATASPHGRCRRSFPYGIAWPLTSLSMSAV